MIAGLSAPWVSKGRTSPVLTWHQQRPYLHQRKSPRLVFLPLMMLLLVVTTFVELSGKNFIFTRQRTFVKQQAAAVLGLEMERDFWYLNNETLAK